jgi:hypothetical protein
MAKLSIHDVLAYFREAASSNRDLGDHFERLICCNLERDPIFVERFARMWMWNEFPRKGTVSNLGIDIVAEEQPRTNTAPSSASPICRIKRSRRRTLTSSSPLRERRCSPPASNE